MPVIDRRIVLNSWIRAGPGRLSDHLPESAGFVSVADLTGRRLAPAQLLDRIVIALGTTAAEQREWAEAWYRVCAHREAISRAGTPNTATVPRQLPQAVAHFTEIGL